MDRLEFFVLSLAGLIPGFALHEFAHAFMADLLGDDTPRRYGRLTLEPWVHLDFFGTLLIALTGFGWAKPVPFNPYRFRDPRRGTLLVALAGPAANVVLAFLFGIMTGIARSVDALPAVIRVLDYALLINAALAAFNLLPVPPLDGSKVLMSLLPRRLEKIYRGLEMYTPFLVLLIFMVPQASRVLLYARGLIVRVAGVPGIMLGTSVVRMFR